MELRTMKCAPQGGFRALRIFCAAYIGVSGARKCLGAPSVLGRQGVKPYVPNRSATIVSAFPKARTRALCRFENAGISLAHRYT